MIEALEGIADPETTLKPASKPPPIRSLDELMTREEFAERFKISRVTIDQWRYGKGAVQVPMPYFRFANRIYLWEGALIWWFNQQVERPDAYRIDRERRAKRGRPFARR